MGFFEGGGPTIAFGTGVETALGVNIGTAGAPVVNGGALGTPSSGILSSCTVDGSNSIGFRIIPQNSQSDNYTLVLTDSGKHILETGASKTITIPANSSVAYPTGTTISFIVTDASGITIAITTDTLRWAKDGTTGSRTLAQYGVATVIKIDATNWLISGTGLS